MSSDSGDLQLQLHESKDAYSAFLHNMVCIICKWDWTLALLKVCGIFLRGWSEKEREQNEKVNGRG